MDFGRVTEIVNRIAKGRNIHQHLDLIAGLPGEDVAKARIVAPRLERITIAVFASNHGIAARGVSAYPPEDLVGFGIADIVAMDLAR